MMLYRLYSSPLIHCPQLCPYGPPRELLGDLYHPERDARCRDFCGDHCGSRREDEKPCLLEFEERRAALRRAAETGTRLADRVDLKNRDPIDKNVKEFRPIGDDVVYVLGADAKLWKEHPDRQNRELIDENVKEFRPVADDVVYVLGVDGNLWREHPDRKNRDPIDKNVKEFRPIGDGVVYVLGADGRLWKERPDLSSREPIDEKVMQFRPLGDSVLYVLGADGKLWRICLPTKSRTDR